MKIRFGVGLGGGTAVGQLPEIVDRLEARGVASRPRQRRGHLHRPVLQRRRRIGQWGDGWLGSFLTPDEARLGRESIQRAAAEAGREIEPDHFGLSLAVAENGLPDEVVAAVRKRRPDADPADLLAADWPQLHRQLDGLIAAGLTKFVIRPVGATPIDEFIDRFVDELLPRQN